MTGVRREWDTLTDTIDEMEATSGYSEHPAARMADTLRALVDLVGGRDHSGTSRTVTCAEIRRTLTHHLTQEGP